MSRSRIANIRFISHSSEAIVHGSGRSSVKRIHALRTNAAKTAQVTLLMGVHHFFWFVWEGVVVELAGSVSTGCSWNADSCL